MQALIIKLLISSFLSILAKIATPAVFEEAMTLAIIKAAKKLASMTDNNYDDHLVTIVETALKTPVPKIE